MFTFEGLTIALECSIIRYSKGDVNNMKKIKYVDNDGNELKKVMIYFEINETGESLETILLLPKNIKDEEIAKIARQFRDEETKYGWYYPDEDEED